MTPESRVPNFELVVVTYRSRTQVEGLLEGLPPDLPLVVVDNSDGADGIGEMLADRPDCRVLHGGGRGFARAANLGALTSEYDTVVFVNPDARPTLDTLWSLVDDVRADDTLASSAGTPIGRDGYPELGTGGWEPTVRRAVAHAAALHKVAPKMGLYARPAPGEAIELDWTTGACMAVRTEVFRRLGGFDEGFFVYSEDVAFGHTVRALGLRQRLRTDLLVPHASGGSGAPSLEMCRLRGASMARYMRTRRGGIAGRLITATVAGGYLVRFAGYRLRRNPARAAEHLSYARGALTGRAWVAGEEVTSRD